MHQYKFEGSQSLEIRDYKVPLQPHGHGKPNQTGRKSSNLPTPPVQTAKIKKVKKIKRCKFIHLLERGRERERGNMINIFSSSCTDRE